MKKKQETSSSHKDNTVSFNLLGKNFMRMFLSQSYKHTIEKHNNGVRKNRKVLSILIDGVVFSGF